MEHFDSELDCGFEWSFAARGELNCKKVAAEISLKHFPIFFEEKVEKVK